MKYVEFSDELWTRISSILHEPTVSTKGGRPRLNPKKVFEGIVFIKINKLPWKAMPTVFGSKTAINDYYRYWINNGFFYSLKESKILTPIELHSFSLDWDLIESTKNKIS